MEPNLHLVLHNVLAIGSAIPILATVIMILVADHKKVVNVTLALSGIAFAVFLVSHTIGVSVTDPELSRWILMFNISTIFICIFNFHCVMAALKREKEKEGLIIFVYTIGLSLAIFYILFPDTFLLTSVPKMYFPEYYVPGSLHWVMRVIFNIALPIYFVYELVRAFRKTANDQVERNRLLYFALSLGLVWLFGNIPIFLIWNIPIDPAYGIFSGLLFCIPFTYAILRYEILDIRVIAKKAFVLAITIVIVGSFILLFNFSTQTVQGLYPEIPFWIMPLISALIIVALATLIWRQLRQADILKYEFITTATHKFRTPLTHIKWAAENLSGMALPPEATEQLNFIQSSNGKLTELTNMLMSISGDGDRTYNYQMERVDIRTIIVDARDALVDQIKAKGVKFLMNTHEIAFVSCDVSRIRFIIQTFIENAIHYTPPGGTIEISLSKNKTDVVFSIKDSGIGISHEDMGLLFTKFHRSKDARLADTEGMGIGLYIAKEIILRHHGRIWAESEGLGKGSTFRFSLPEVE